MEPITIRNETLTVRLDSVGGGLNSIQRAGTEYVWVADPAFWKFHDKNLFPYVGRTNGGHYLLDGKTYEIPIHGFCTDRPFEVAEQGADFVRFALTDSDETRAMYPFSFRFEILYKLEGDALIKRCTVTNTDSRTLYFGIGAHPGFNVPLGGDGEFTDWYFEFPEACEPVRVEFDPANCLISGVESPYPLQDGRVLPLTHDLFDQDAVVLRGTPRRVTLKSDKSAHSVTVDFPDMPFLGLWHAVKKAAPYVCIEPWASLPSRSGVTEDLATQPNIIHLPAGEVYTNTLTFTIR